jgi:hypothetical protein
METAFQISYAGVMVSGTVIHGGHRHGYGAVPPEVIFEAVIDEDASAAYDFDGWLTGVTGMDTHRRRQIVAELEEEAIAKVVTPRDPEDEAACRGDYERDARKDSDR